MTSQAKYKEQSSRSAACTIFLTGQVVDRHVCSESNGLVAVPTETTSLRWRLPIILDNYVRYLWVSTCSVALHVQRAPNKIELVWEDFARLQLPPRITIQITIAALFIESIFLSSPLSLTQPELPKPPEKPLREPCQTLLLWLPRLCATVALQCRCRSRGAQPKGP
jgi:hypothetical protein